MANFIRVPLLDTVVNVTYGGVPRYGLVNVTNAYDVQMTSPGDPTGEHIRIYTTLAADSTAVQCYIIEYNASHGDVATDLDLEKLRNLIISANQNPGSNPIFTLIPNALNGDTNVEDDYLVDDIVVVSESPI